MYIIISSFVSGICVGKCGHGGMNNYPRHVAWAEVYGNRFVYPCVRVCVCMSVCVLAIFLEK